MYILSIIRTNKCTNIYIKTFYKHCYMFQCFCTSWGSINCGLAKVTKLLQLLKLQFIKSSGSLCNKIYEC